MASEGKPTTQRRRQVLLVALNRKDGEGRPVLVPKGDPVPDDLSSEETARLKRIGAIGSLADLEAEGE